MEKKELTQQVTKCRDCDKKATWVFTNMPMSWNPFACNVHAKKYRRMEIHMMGYQEVK